MLLDTSGLLSLFDRSATFHSESLRAYQGAPRLLLHNYVLTEFIPLSHVRRMPRPQSIEFVRDLLHHPRIELAWVDEQLHRQAMDLLAQRLDKTYSVCDAVSFLLMRQRRLTEALTTDHHFEQEGFIRLLK